DTNRRTGLHTRYGSELPTFDEFASNRICDIPEEAMTGPPWNLINPVQLDRLANIVDRRSLVPTGIAKRCVAPAIARTERVGNGMAQHIAALRQQAFGHTTAKFYLKSMVVAVTAICLKVCVAGCQRGVDLEHVDRVVRRSQTPHARGVRRDRLGQ